MNVLLYVEGPADRAALPVILSGLIDEARQRRVGIRFILSRGKDRLLADLPSIAANHLAEHPQDWIFALPDLYPVAKFAGTDSAHRSCEELAAILLRRFKAEADRLRLQVEVRERFRAHCLKYDLEVLLLADPEALRQRLRTRDRLEGHWRQPPEDQNDGHPPRHIVTNLFRRYLKRPYDGVVDAPATLRLATIDRILASCPQCFVPFVRDLRQAAGL